LAAGGIAFGTEIELPNQGLPAINHQPIRIASRIRMPIRMGTGDRRRRWNNGPAAGGLMRGSVVAWPQR
jgi:hypothetical protein